MPSDLAPEAKSARRRPLAAISQRPVRRAASDEKRNPPPSRKEGEGICDPD